MLERSDETELGARPGLDLDALMDALRAEVELRKRRAAGPDTPRAEPARRSATRDARELLGLPVAEFVAEAYVAILGRKPLARESDPSIDRLLLGQVSRTAFLRELLQTKEARLRGAKVRGLTTAALLDAAPARAVIGWRSDIAHALRTLYLLPRRIPKFVARVDVLEKELASANARLGDLERRLGAADAAAGGAATAAPDTGPHGSPAPRPDAR